MFCCVWYNLGNNIFFYYDFFIVDFKLYILSILSYRGCWKGVYMYFCFVFVFLVSIIRDFFQMKVCWFRGKNVDFELELEVLDVGKGLYIYF